eukprot:3939727-Rhodomonas_salina.1
MARKGAYVRLNMRQTVVTSHNEPLTAVRRGPGLPVAHDVAVLQVSLSTGVPTESDDHQLDHDDDIIITSPSPGDSES